MNKPASELIALADELNNYAIKYSGDWASASPTLPWSKLALIIDTLRTAAKVDARRWRHKKRGTTYAEVGKAEVQAEDPLTDYEVVQVYRCEQDGTLWVRRLSEFHDGRFEALATPPAQPAPASDNSDVETK